MYSYEKVNKYHPDKVADRIARQIHLPRTTRIQIRRH